jgi:xylulokinase
VAVGAMDSAAAALGAGALSVGDAVLALGTTARVMAVTRTLEAHPSLISCGYPIPGLWLMMGVVWRAGTALRSAASQWTGTSDFGRLDAEASSVAASETEFRYDADSGAFLGRTPEHGPAHVARAVMEGVADSLNARSRLIESHLDRPLSKVVIVGGGSRSTLLTRLVAQRLRCDVAISSDPDAEPRGAAIIAAAAAGVYPDLLSAARAMSRAGGEPC